MSTEEPTSPTDAALATPATKNLRYEIEWHYKPGDFFSTAVSEHVLGCDLTIDKATALARITAETYEASPNLQRQIHRWLDARFKGQQFRTAKPYELDSGSLTEYRHDGTRVRHLSAFISAKSSMTADFVISDGAGNIVFDSTAQRGRQKAQHESNRIALIQLDAQLEATIQAYFEKEVQPEEPLVTPTGETPEQLFGGTEISDRGRSRRSSAFRQEASPQLPSAFGYP